MKRIFALILFSIMALVMPVYVYAATSDNIDVISEFSDQEILEFLDAYDVEIPGGSENITEWIDFIRKTIQLVEQDPGIYFCYSFTVTQEFAEKIQLAVLEYYGYADIVSPISWRDSDAYTLQDSIEYGSWDESYRNYNCYSYALGRTDNFWNPGNLSGIYYTSLPTLSQLRQYVQQDLETLGYDCVKTSTIRPTSSSIPSGAKVICLRSGSVDYHFMKYYSSMWLHKPGNTQLLQWKYTSPGAKYWTNEYVYKGVPYEGDTEYTSTIYYFTLRTDHSYTTQHLTGEEYHSNGRHYYKVELVCNNCEESSGTYQWISHECDGPPCAILTSTGAEAIYE